MQNVKTYPIPMARVISNPRIKKTLIEKRLVKQIHDRKQFLTSDRNDAVPHYITSDKGTEYIKKNMKA